MTYSFGPGPWSPAVRAIILANLAVFVVSLVAPLFVLDWLGLSPARVMRGELWELVTYMFVHSPRALSHILFNMLAVWMFGTELERRWGTVAFAKYYFVTGVGAGICVVAVSLLPFDDARATYEPSAGVANVAVPANLPPARWSVSS